ncbi:hypothetical protein DV737_g4088, partial [Chaetothyriales sp. CBS 132003]
MSTALRPVLRPSTRDTRNAPLWNPSSQELLSIEDDEAGRLAGFRARFGSSFDSKKPVAAADAKPASDVQDAQAKRQDVSLSKAKDVEEEDGWDFGDDDANLLDLISSFGQEEIKVRDDQVVKKSGKK